MIIKLKLNGTWIDISQHVVSDSFEKSERLYSKLVPNTTTISFLLNRNVALFNQIVSETDVVDIEVVGLFKGTLTPNYSTKILQGKGLESIRLEAEDYTQKKLKTKIVEDLVYQNKTVSYIVSDLTTKAGITTNPINPVLSNVVISLVVLEDDKKSYFDILKDILFEYGYTFYLDSVGLFTLFDWASASTLNVPVESTGTSLLREVEIKKTIEEYTEVLLKWNRLELKTDVVLIKDTTGQDSLHPSCYIEVQPGAFYPKDATTDIDYYLDYKSDQWDIYSANTATLNVTKDAGIDIIRPLENFGRKCLFLLKNNSALVKYISSLDVSGNAYVKIDENTTRLPIRSINDKPFEYECKYISTKTDTDYLSKALRSYYLYSDFVYTIYTKNDHEIGSIVMIQDTAFTNSTIYGRVVDKTTQGNSTTIKYVLEGINDYDYSSITSLVGSVLSPSPADVSTPVLSGLDENGSVIKPIDSTLMTQALLSTNGLGLDANYLGFRLNGLWDSYFKSDGTFRLKDKLVFDGTNLSVSGAVTATSGSFTGTITASSGTIGGFTLASTTITGGSLSLANTGNITAGTSNDVARISANDVTYRMWIGNATAASAPFRVTKAGVLTASGVTISGAITATSGSFTGTISTSNITATGGTVGGFTLASTTLTGGALSLVNTGNITAGTSNEIIRVSADDATYRMWIGNATSSSAPFRVTKAGVLTATGATISGAITATSGSFTGTISTSNITATGGTVGGWSLTSDKLSSASTGASIVLDKTKSRISVLDSAGISKVVMGYLEGLQDPSEPTHYFDSSDYGYWIAPGDAVSFNGEVKVNGAAFSVTNGNISLISQQYLGTQKEIAKIEGNSITSFWPDNHDNSFQITLNAFQKNDTVGTDMSSLRLNAYKNGSIVDSMFMGFVQIDGVSAPVLTANMPIEVVNGLKINSLQAGIDVGGGFIKHWGQSGGDYTNDIITKDTTSCYKYRTIKDGVWSYNYNQDLLTTSQVTFNRVTTMYLTTTSTSLATNLNADLLDGYHASNTGGIPVSNGTINSSLNADMIDGYHLDQSVQTTASPSFSKITSTVATGTAPLVVTSTTKVANLNADLLDGYSAGNSSGLIPLSNGTINANLNADMLDGKHFNDFATSTHTHDYLPLAGGTIYGQLTSSVTTGTAPLVVASTTKVTNLNADLLDGNDSTYFQKKITISTSGPTGGSQNDLWIQV